MHKIKDLYHHFLLSDGVTTDSRDDVTNKIFFALSGENFNGNKFSATALNKGAILCVIDDPSYNTNEKCFIVSDVLATLQDLASYHRKESAVEVFAITGTNGKTTTKELASSVLSSHIDIISTRGNFNNHIGVPLTLLNIKPSTKIAIIEMGANHIGEIERLCEIAKPDFGLITNIGKAHLEGFGSFDGVIIAKNELYNYISDNNGKVIVNKEDNLLTKLSKNIPQLTYGKNNADVEGEIIESKPYLNIRWANTEKTNVCISHLYGKYNFDNIMAAIAVGLFFKVPKEKINAAIEGYIPENNRSQHIKTKNNSVILDAYNANPTSMNGAIESFTEHNLKNPWLILGDMFELGEYSMAEHQQIIELLNEKSHYSVILIGENFYHTQGHSFTKFRTTEDAYEYLRSNRITDASILVKGSRGMKLESLLELL